MGVDARADGGAAQGKFAEMFLQRSQPRDAVAYLAGVTAKLLAQPDGRGVLQMRPANF